MQNIKLEPDNFELQTTSVWDFPDRGKWATHDASYRGNWSPYIPRNIILRYSSEQELILDQFTGSGTTFKLKEVVIKKQHNCQSARKWVQKSKENNFLLLAHEYLFIFKK